MTKVCRLCLTRLQRGSKYFNINAVESFTGFMPYRDQLTTCIPEMALDLIPCPVICNNCRTALKSSYDFKSRCLLVEKKIREYIESLPMETTNFDLSVIDTSELPKITRIATAAEVEQAKKEPQEKKQDRKKSPEIKETSLLSNLLTLKKEEILNPNTSKAKATYQQVKNSAVTESVTHSSPTKEPPSIDTSQGKKYLCNHCHMAFLDVPTLHRHKQTKHEEEFLCNFCNQPFRSLQNLRRHNIQCQKITQIDPSQSIQIANTILTKRPHLPMKAKNHLKKWLFRHTDHPYPTDVEKQQLMKETGLSLLQVENWFINARRRILGDLTKLKNMRGRGRQKTRPSKGQISELELDNDDLDLDQEAEKLYFPPDNLDEEKIVPLSALKKLNDSLKMDIDSSLEINSSMEENEDDSTDENINLGSSSILQISSVEGGVEDDDSGDITQDGDNGEDAGDPLADEGGIDEDGVDRMQEGEDGDDHSEGSSENSEEPENPKPIDVKMEIVDDELKLSNNKKPKLTSVKQEPHNEEGELNSLE